MPRQSTGVIDGQKPEALQATSSSSFAYAAGSPLNKLSRQHAGNRTPNPQLRYCLAMAEGSLLCRAGAHRFLPAWLPDGGHNGAMLTRLRDQLVAEGEEALRAEPGLVRFTGNHEADELLNDLADHPHAFVFAALVDRQVKVERAWMVPLLLRQRLGSFEIRDLESLPEGQWLSLMREPRCAPYARDDGKGPAPGNWPHPHPLRR